MEDFFETEITISPDDEVSEYLQGEAFNPIETEAVYTPNSTQEESDPVIVSDPIGVEETVPDAITINENENAEISSGVVPDGSASGNTEALQTETDGTISETLDSIYQILEERIPEKESESESETKNQNLDPVQETEKSLTDIYNEINSVRELESEQLAELRTIRDNNIVSNNNVYHLASFQIAITSAIFGSILIALLFRKIS